MVMHARKPQRISDGYFDKHQAHPYQNIKNSKNERRHAPEYVDARYCDSVRTPVSHHYSHAQTDRNYARVQASKERERDYYKSSRDKYADYIRSPKDRRIKEERERSNHERSNSEVKKNRTNKFDKRTSTDIVTTVGDWSEHTSSTGKVYYYNSVSEVSQWERPREWETRRNSSKEANYATARNNHNKKALGHTSRDYEKSHHHLHNDTVRQNCQYREKSCTDDERKYRDARNSSSTSKHPTTTMDDMDISPSSSSTNFENNYSRGARSYTESRLQQLPASSTTTASFDTSSTSTSSATVTSCKPLVQESKQTPLAQSLLAAALPRISTQEVSALVSNCSNAHPNGATPLSPNGDTLTSTDTLLDRDPPTPTHSETTDGTVINDPVALPKKMETLGSYSSVVGQYSSIVQGGFPTTPLMTPSLANHARSDLTTHMLGWPADLVEKQAIRCWEEAHQLGCLQCTRVCAELKCARSLVRHTEIQATLQEQKIMYLRQQIQRLEELKLQNSFMPDDL